MQILSPLEDSFSYEIESLYFSLYIKRIGICAKTVFQFIEKGECCMHRIPESFVAWSV